MEDAHSFVADFAGVRGQGYFAVFDGHAGKHAAEWCGEHFHEKLLDSLHSFAPEAEQKQKISIPDVLNKTFHSVDEELSRMADEGQTHSGCTAVTAFLRLEDDDGCQPRNYLDSAYAYQQTAPPNPLGASTAAGNNNEKVGNTSSSGSSEKSSGFKDKVKNTVRNITGKSPTNEPEDLAASSSTSSAPPTAASRASISSTHSVGPNTVFPQATRRVLYTANAGDARAVLSRGGKAVRLTYDHKGSDAQEARRIKEAGGFVMNNRVNGASISLRTSTVGTMSDPSE